MKAKYIRTHLHIAIGAIALALTLSLSACTNDTSTTGTAETAVETAVENTDAAADSGSTAEHIALTADDITINDTIENSEDGGHAINVDGEEASYSNTAIEKTGESDGDEADFFGENAAVFATNGATLTISESRLHSNGTHANGIFSYGDGTTVNVSDSLIETEGNCSGGLMTTGGGTMNAENVTIHTSGNSSAAIRSDRGGGTVNVTKSYATTSGTGSPAIYSTADITVSDSYLESDGSEGIVIEGKNSVTLENVDLVANQTKTNSDKSDNLHGVMIYQSMSGDAAEGLSSFTMTDGTLINKNGDVFFINNTACDINLTNAVITNEDADGLFLRAAAAGWGQEGANGGQVNLNASGQTIDGNIVADDISVLNMYLKDGSSFTGAINSDGAAGEVYVELDADSTWTLTGDSSISSLTCDADSIDLNGHTLYVDGEKYDAGTASKGDAIEITIKEGNGMPGEPPADGMGPNGGQKPDGNGKPGDGQTPPQKPDGNDKPGDGQTPPERPEGFGDGQTPPELPEGMEPGQAPNGQPPEKPGENAQ